MMKMSIAGKAYNLRDYYETARIETEGVKTKKLTIYLDVPDASQTDIVNELEPYLDTSETVTILDDDGNQQFTVSPNYKLKEVTRQMYKTPQDEEQFTVLMNFDYE